MGKNRKNQATAVRLVPALKTFLLCLLIGGSAAGYVLQKNTIYELGKQIREKEAVLERLKWENRIRANQLADLQSPTKLAERSSATISGVFGPNRLTLPLFSIGRISR